MSEQAKNWQEATNSTLHTWLSKSRRGLITDVDGTISPIVNRPDAAHITRRSRELLTELVNYLDVLAVVSGRAAVDVQARVGVPGMIYVGNHGLERWRDGDVDIPTNVQVYLPMIKAAYDVLTPYERSIPGVLVENKTVTLSVHYRNVNNPQAVTLKLKPILENLSQKLNLRIFEGRMIFEVRPPIDTHKGSALKALVKEYALDSVIYMGDDTTDVDAIKAARELREKGLCYAFGFGVAGEETPIAVLESADFTLDGVPGVEAFLDWLLSALRASSN